MARQLMAGERTTILGALRKHGCSGARCPSTDKGECAVKAAIRYLANNEKHMDYPTFVVEGLPIGSGEIEGLIRHAVRRRLDIPGDWREENLKLMTAILTIRHSGWWDEFWGWRDNRDRMQMRQRIKGHMPNRFRGPARPRPLTAGQETLDLDDLSPMFASFVGVYAEPIHEADQPRFRVQASTRSLNSSSRHVESANGHGEPPPDSRSHPGGSVILLLWQNESNLLPVS